MITDKTIHTEKRFVYRNKYNGKWLNLFWLAESNVAHEVDIISDASFYKAKNLIQIDFDKMQVFYEDDENNIVSKREDYELIEILLSFEHTKNENI